MQEKKYVDATHKEMAYGYTTGSCAAAAAKAAMYKLLTGIEAQEISLDTPKGWKLQLPTAYVENAKELGLDLSWLRSESVTCGVRKDAGDDPDVTHGVMVYASVCAIAQQSAQSLASVQIEGGVGVGRVTLPGLNQPVGAAAINDTPRKMIAEEVENVCEEYDFHGTVQVLISIPDGVELAGKTFNPRLGIVGGISVLGTSGIVEPMSKQSLLDTIQVELRVQKEAGVKHLVIAPGNMGMDYMKRQYGYDLDKAVKCSNYVGETLDMALALGFSGILFIGNIGKAVKLAGGIMNTHSKEADCRLEILASISILAGANDKEARAILSCITTEEALQIAKDKVWFGAMKELLLEKMHFYLEHRLGGAIPVGVITFSSVLGELGMSKGAEELLEQSLTEAERMSKTHE